MTAESPVFTINPSDAATRYAVTVGIAVRITAKNFATALKYLQRLPGEFLALGCKLAYKRDNTISSSTAFVKFITDNPKLWSRS